MKTRVKTGILLILIAAIAVLAAVLLLTRVKSDRVFAEGAETVRSDGYIVSDDIENISAVYEFVRLNETECSVRIANKTEATKAIIPSKATIDGVEYKVTEVANNGFMSSPKLIRVSLPNSVKKIGSNAFYNCVSLNRINLANVEEIGNSAFYKCPQLEEIVIPKSVNKIGTYILRNNDTKVRVRAEADGEGWSASWNKSNTNQDVEYSSEYVQPLELEPIYDLLARSSDAVIGYSVAGGQPRNDEFYTITEDNGDDVSDVDSDNNLFIPAQYDGKDVLAIAASAFSGAVFEQLIVEYSDKTLSIGNGAFEGTPGASIVINRPIEYYDAEYEQESNSIFFASEVNSIVLPDNITSIAESMFTACENLTNIYFVKPQDMDREAALKIIYSQSEELGVIEIPSYIEAIGENAFDCATAISELHIYDTVKEMGATVVSGWDSDRQTVYIHNENKIIGWHPQWDGGFDNVVYDNTFYTVTFDPDGGNFVGSDDSVMTADVKLGQPIGALPEVEKEENDFLGWYMDGIMFTPETEYTFDRDIVLVAQWRTITYTISFEFEGGEGEKEYVKVAIGDTLPKSDVPTRAGYTFQGFYEFPNGEGTRYYYDDMGSTYVWDRKEDITVYAYWKGNEYKIELYSGYGENEKIQELKVVCGEEMPYAKFPEREHYVFNGYFDGMDEDGTRYYNADMSSTQVWDKPENGKLYAHWIPVIYQITYELEGGLNKGDNPDNYNVESTFTLKEATHETLYFDGWLYNGEKITSVKGLSGDIVLVATWSEYKNIEIILKRNILLPITSYPISDRKVRLILKGDNTANTAIQVASTVTSLCIDGDSKYYNMSICISDRQSDFVLYLHNIVLRGAANMAAITMQSPYNLFLYSTGNVTIGNVLIRIGTQNGDGVEAIRCYSLVISTFENCEHNLVIKGCDGMFGDSGNDGQNGYNGGNGIIAERVIIKCNNVSIYGGNGGNGGSATGLFVGYRGLGGAGAYPIVGPEWNVEVSMTEEFDNVFLVMGVDGKEGTGNYPPTNVPDPIDPTLPDFPTPSFPRPDPDVPYIPPITPGDLVPTPGPVVPPIYGS